MAVAEFAPPKNGTSLVEGRRMTPYTSSWSTFWFLSPKPNKFLPVLDYPSVTALNGNVSSSALESLADPWTRSSRRILLSLNWPSFLKLSGDEFWNMSYYLAGPWAAEDRLFRYELRLRSRGLDTDVFFLAWPDCGSSIESVFVSLILNVGCYLIGRLLGVAYLIMRLEREFSSSS